MTSWFWSKRNIFLTIGIVLLLIPHALFLLQPFFMDERATLTNVVKFAHELTLIPHHTKYPTFYSYIATPFIGLGAFWHSVFGDTGTLKESVAFAYKLEPLILILPARLLSLAVMTGSILVVGAFLSRRFGKRAGFTAGAAALATPALLSYGSYGLPDATVLGLCALSLIFALRFFDACPQSSSTAQLVLSAFVAGLAISTKYNAFASVFPIGAACILLFLSGRTNVPGMIRMTLLSAAVCVGAFLLGSPGWIIAPETMLDGLRYEMEHAKYGHLGMSGMPVLGYIELLLTEMPVLFVGGILGIGCWVKDRPASALLPLSLIAATICMSAFSAKQSLYYLYPMFGALLYFWAYAISHVEAYGRTLSIVIPVICIAVLYAVSLDSALKYVRPNTTALAADWMYRNIPEGSRVARDWAYVPTVYSAETFQQLKPSRITSHIRATARLYDVVPLEWSTDWIEYSTADYFVTSDAAYSRFFEHGLFTRIEPAAGTALGEEFNRTKSFYEALFTSGKWVEVFSADTGNGPETVIYRRER